MLQVLIALNGAVFIDEGLLECADSGRGACVLSRQLFERGSEFLLSGRYDSAYVYFRRSFESIEGLPLDLWKTYLLYLLLRTGTKQSYVVDYRFPDSEELLRYMALMDTLSRMSILRPLFLAAGRAVGIHVMHGAPIADTTIPYFNTGIRTHMRVPVYVPYAEFTLDTILTPYFNAEVFAFNWTWQSMNFGFVRDSDMRVLRNIFRLENPHLRIFYFSVMGRILAQRGYYESARSHAWYVENLVDSLEYGLATAVAYNNLGDLFLIFLKDPIQSLRYYLTSLKVLDSIGIGHSKTYATVCNNVGMAYYNAGRPERAVAMLRRALRVQMEIVEEPDAEASNIMSNMARAFEDMGMYDSAILYTLETIRLRKRIYGENSDQVLLKMLELARLYATVGDTSRAMGMLHEAQSIRWNPARSIYPPAYIYRNFYEIHHALGNRDSAYFYIGLLLSDSSGLQAAYYPYFLLKYLNLRLSMEDSIPADTIPFLLDEILTRLQGLTFTTPYTRRIQLESMLGDLSRAVPLMVDRGVPAGAIVRLGEYFKGRILVDEVEFSRDRVVDSLTRLLYSISGRGASLEELLQVEGALERRKWELGRRFRMDHIPPVREGEALLGFVVSDSFLISYLVSRRDTFIRMVPVLRDSLWNLVGKVVSRPDIRIYSSALYGLTLAPWEDHLHRYGRVALSLHDFLRNVSFLSLYTGRDYVVEHPYSLYRVFSFYSYDEPCRIEGPVLAVGSDFLSSGPENPGRLVYASREVSKILNLMGGRAGWSGRDSLKDFSGYQLLHFATHILVDDTPMILLESPEGTVRRISLYDVLSSIRVGEAVVLSGCRSGAGRPINGWEGLMSLTRAFVYSGARCVVASLREVNDMAAYIFMDRFYEALSRGEAMDTALRKAALYMLRNTGLDSPVYWGAFTLTVFRR